MKPAVSNELFFTVLHIPFEVLPFSSNWGTIELLPMMYHNVIWGLQANKNEYFNNKKYMEMDSRYTFLLFGKI